MDDCRICNKQSKSILGLSLHLRNKHGISLLEYVIKYENFKIPKCSECDKDASYSKGLVFQKTCGNKVCLSKVASKRKHSEETKKKLRKKRLAYMQANPQCTAWRTGNAMSWPEKVFINAVERTGWYEKFEITREKSFYPYFVDFAFENVKVAVEIDGSQHDHPERKASDDKKDVLLISQGWRVYRVKAKQVLSDVKAVICELELFIGEVETEQKTSELLTGKEKKLKESKLKKKRKTSELLTGKEKKELEVKRKREENRKVKEEEIRKLVEERKKAFEIVNMFKFGWVQKIAEVWNLSHTQTKRWVRKYHPEVEYYQRKDYTPIE